MTVNVYIWEKRKDQGSVGHVSMSLSDGTHISWWPEDQLSKGKSGKQLTSPVIQGQTLKADTYFEGYYPVIYTLCMSFADEQKIKTWWTNFTAITNVFHLFGMNCSTVVYMALKEAYPSLNSLGAVTPIWTPGAIEEVMKMLCAGVTCFTYDMIRKFQLLVIQITSQYMKFLIV